MENATLTAESIVKSAQQGEYAVPEFQRTFVWTPQKVLEFVDSLSRGYPVGSILMWKSDTALALGVGKQQSQQSKSWLIDGQQRTTALCTLFGVRPEWWDDNLGDNWTTHQKKFDIRLDVKEEDLTFRVVKNTSNTAPKRYVPVREIVQCENLYSFAEDLVKGGETFTKEAGTVANHLEKVKKLKTATMPVVTIDDEIELPEVAEIFKRLNSTGTRVQQADIYLGVVAARNPGWVNRNFLTFIKKLEEDGFEIEPAFLFRTFTAIGAQKSRYKDVPSDFWGNPNKNKAWDSTRRALGSVCQGLREYGIISADLVLSVNAVVASAIYRAKFPNGSFGPVLAWMICAIKDGFFAGPIETRLDRLIGAIQSAKSSGDALKDLYGLLTRSYGNDAFTTDEFLEARSSGSSLERLMIYLLAHNNDAKDWNTDGYHIRAEAHGQYHPEWHHIFPRKWLRDNMVKIDNKEIDTVANMAVISADANKKISASAPNKYVTELNLLKRGCLDQQVIPNPASVGPDEYRGWLKKRAEMLAQESNKYLAELRSQS